MTPRTVGPARRYGSWVSKSEEGKVRVRGWAQQVCGEECQSWRGSDGPSSNPQAPKCEAL